MDRTWKIIDVGDGKTMVVARDGRMETAGRIEAHCCKPNGTTRRMVGLNVVFVWMGSDGPTVPDFWREEQLGDVATEYVDRNNEEMHVGACTHVASSVGMGKPYHKRTRKQKKDAHILPILLLSHSSPYPIDASTIDGTKGRLRHATVPRASSSPSTKVCGRGSKLEAGAIAFQNPTMSLVRW